MLSDRLLSMFWKYALHAQILRENWGAGDTEARLLSQRELFDLEPSLFQARSVPGKTHPKHTLEGQAPILENPLGAVLCPHEAVVEPWLVPVGLCESALRYGANISLETSVVCAAYNRTKELWKLTLHHTGSGSIMKAGCVRSTYVHARVVINCAGLYGDEVEELRRVNGGDSYGKADFTIVPRKGQFLIYGNPMKPSNTLVPVVPSSSNAHLTPQHIIERIPTPFTKGVIVWQSVYGNIVVGPTSVAQVIHTISLHSFILKVTLRYIYCLLLLCRKVEQIRRQTWRH